MSQQGFKSSRNSFFRKNAAFVDMVTGHMALDIEVALKTSAGMPVDKGQLKAATRSFRSQLGNQRVEINKEYAAVQEAGIRKSGPGAPTRRFKNYTTAGTSSGFFARAIAMVTRNKLRYIEEAKRALNL